jgi:hypothetical protein
MLSDLETFVRGLVDVWRNCSVCALSLVGMLGVAKRISLRMYNCVMLPDVRGIACVSEDVCMYIYI